MSGSALPVVIDPFALLEREPSAMAALMLGDPVITFLPICGGDGHLDDVCFTEKYPATKAALFRMSWLAELARGGAIVGGIHGDYVLHAVAWALNFGLHYEPVKPLYTDVQASILESPASLVEFVSTAFSAATPPPVPFIAAGMGTQAFAYKHNLTLAGARHPLRPSAEWQIEREIFAHLVPILKAANADQMLAAREILSDTLHPLRLGISQVKACLSDDPNADDLRQTVADHVLPSLVEYREAFQSRRTRFLASLADSEKEVATGVATVCGLLLSGAPGLAAAMTGTATTAIGLGAKFARITMAERDLQRRTMFGFVARMENR